MLKSTKSAIKVVSPLTGRVVKLSDVPDSIFSNKVLGDGIAIKPTIGELLSPVDGIIKQIFPTKHAIEIKTKCGIRILIHLGIDTVELEGQGFKKFINQGEQVKAGDRLIDFDLDYINSYATSIITPLLITNMTKVKKINFFNLLDVNAGESEILEVIIK